MAKTQRPQLSIARRVLPEQLLRAVAHIFGQSLQDTMLVGGTALAGFYAGHRRSDDLDLFCRDTAAFKATRLAALSLQALGAHFNPGAASNQYWRSMCTLSGYSFTIDVVGDENLFRFGKSRQAGVIAVASLETLLAQKAATLVSRCSEKDLYDLLWLLPRFKGLTLSQFIAIGQEVDAGLSAETALLTITSTKLHRASCAFVDNSGKAFEEITALREKLITGFVALAQKEAVTFAKLLELDPG